LIIGCGSLYNNGAIRAFANILRYAARINLSFQSGLAADKNQLLCRVYHIARLRCGCLIEIESGVTPVINRFGAQQTGNSRIGPIIE
jgi:hypothetical protein